MSLSNDAAGKESAITGKSGDGSGLEEQLKEKLTLEEISDLAARKGQYKLSSQQYIDQHPEIHKMWNDFQTSVLIHKPENVYEFAREFFTSTYVPTQEQLVRPLVICGPSGVGKGTLIQKLFDNLPDTFGFSVSHTTRAPREGEVNGVHYNFVSREVMTNAIDEGRFLEYAHVHKNIYGTSYDAVKKVQLSGKICVLDIDVQGVKKLKEIEEHMKPKPFYIFIAPPSIEILQNRLRSRGTESDEQIQTRISVAEMEVKYGTKAGNFDKVVVNDILEDAFSELKTALGAEYDHLAAFDAR